MSDVMNEVMGRAANQGAMATAQESAEIASIQAKMILARNFPRDVDACRKLILSECLNKELAERAAYEFPRGDSVVRGPSIRLVECVARHWGNIQSGIKEIASNGLRATVKAFCWDLETNFSDEKIFDVEYKRTTKKGSYILTDERDKYEMLANMAARRKRACMQAVIPQFVIDEAMEVCQATLEAAIKEENSQKSIGEIRASMLDAFRGLPGADWVCEADIETVCGKPFDTIGPKDIVRLRNLYNAVKEGFVKPSAAFKKEDVVITSDPDTEALKDVNEALKQTQAEER